jgi:aminopeptidase N
MENWGLITFREVNLLYEEGVSSTANKQNVAIEIGHELTHMWFGNLGKQEYAKNGKKFWSEPTNTH